ncbi:MAG: dodecin domain-containing protein [Gammaproteobacteria bacterium]|nr:MAG: dodecin domain-containing protein [Gammaproteobacteria bacterium]RLA43385.1 MAG: dodecin domain-containing protein [Gammaproteobacteria bacterium]
MSHGKSNELMGSSTESFEDAMAQILARANKTLRGIRALDVINKHLVVSKAGQLEYYVRAYLQFDMTPPDQLHL